MRYDSIADIYTANARVRERFLEVVNSISPDEANALSQDEKWTIGQIVEHVSIVENSMLRICTKLTAAARESGQPSDGSFQMSDAFKQAFYGAAGTKIEAPERVHPTGEVQIPDALAGMTATSAAIDDLRDELTSFDGSGHTFPHPHFGALTAAEWLVVRGGHENRHTDQIQRIVEKLRK